LLVADEAQSGMFRSGGFLAWHHFNVQPDIVVIAKALSGGLVPIGAVLMTDAAYKPVVVCGEERRKPASGADGADCGLRARGAMDAGRSGPRWTSMSL